MLQAPATSSTGCVSSNTPESTTLQFSASFWLAALAIALLAYVCGHYLRSLFFGSAKPVVSSVQTSLNMAAADVDPLGLAAKLQSMLYSWAVYIGRASAGTMIGYATVCHTKAVMSFAALAAALLGAAVLIYGLGVVADAVLRYFVGQIWAVATAVGLQLKGWALFAMVPSLVVIAAVLSFMALSYVVQVSPPRCVHLSSYFIIAAWSLARKGMCASRGLHSNNAELPSTTLGFCTCVHPWTVHLCMFNTVFGKLQPP